MKRTTEDPRTPMRGADALATKPPPVGCASAKRGQESKAGTALRVLCTFDS